MQKVICCHSCLFNHFEVSQGLTFSTGQIELIQLNFNFYMLIDIEFGQKCYRLNMCGC
ncbi:hypothetical protein [Veillonella sp.]|uniref:hypothetical protein n=1 Tax=Veillonella sp. TaxID=1926307 RepID=UPI002904EE08|nr:hypothetical protein [Veillonella sp.]MDU1127722.1 hypothetical protein [Veillonella sp.]